MSHTLSARGQVWAVSQRLQSLAAALAVHPSLAYLCSWARHGVAGLQAKQGWPCMWHAHEAVPHLMQVVTSTHTHTYTHTCAPSGLCSPGEGRSHGSPSGGSPCAPHGALAPRRRMSPCSSNRKNGRKGTPTKRLGPPLAMPTRKYGGILLQSKPAVAQSRRAMEVARS